jgi:hypothetical protein
MPSPPLSPMSNDGQNNNLGGRVIEDVGIPNNCLSVSQTKDIRPYSCLAVWASDPRQRRGRYSENTYFPFVGCSWESSHNYSHLPGEREQ